MRGLGFSNAGSGVGSSHHRSVGVMYDLSGWGETDASG